MKLRIKDSSFRFRITLKELEQLEEAGRVECRSTVSEAGSPSSFLYSIRVDEAAPESFLDVKPFHIEAVLTRQDLGRLAHPREEGVYFRKQWEETGGRQQRMMFFIEKDRPGSTCEKPEQWIYQENDTGERPQTQDIPNPRS